MELGTDVSGNNLILFYDFGLFFWYGAFVFSHNDIASDWEVFWLLWSPGNKFFVGLRVYSSISVIGIWFYWENGSHVLFMQVILVYSTLCLIIRFQCLVLIDDPFVLRGWGWFSSAGQLFTTQLVEEIIPWCIFLWNRNAIANRYVANFRVNGFETFLSKNKISLPYLWASCLCFYRSGEFTDFWSRWLHPFLLSPI